MPLATNKNKAQSYDVYQYQLSNDDYDDDIVELVASGSS